MYAPQFEHLTSVGALIFQTLERLLFFLAVDVLLFGTAIFIASLIYIQYDLLLFIKQLQKSFHTRINVFFTAAISKVKVFTAFITQPFAIRFTKNF